MEDDLQIIFNDILKVPIPREESLSHNVRVSNKDEIENKTKSYFQELTPELKKSLYQVYKYDFLFFDYQNYVSWQEVE